MRCYKRARAGRPPVDKELDRYAQPDGHGQYGILDDDGQTVLCHECGRRYRSLGAHVFRAHGTTADEYKAAHGLARSRGLASSALREALAARSAQQVGTPAWKRFEAARDPQAAADARTFPPSPAEARRAQVETATLNSRRARRPVVRTCPECGVQWCPLPGGYTRTTCRAPECVRAHAAEATRARARRQEEAIRPLTDDERESLRRLTGSDLMALVRRLLDEGMRQRTLAGAAGISEAGLSRFLSGHRVPGTDRSRPAPTATI
ncbi:MucR family transcriptional regulator (plasmid) [Kitasatospora sp. NBC_01246]|uniref:MucR family transcriptional regulator n=1 Tax=Kitasatospora sp. NBC_01246 TaxID=2903570 RepID=UPI002E33022A|nr:MucR family transcriptional regulator [Kitasatospora sp. NBC_01246]